MKTIIKITLFFLLLLGIHVRAQVQISTKAPERIGVGETFTIRYTLNADVGSAEPSLTEVNSFEILIGPTTSTASSIKTTNGKETTEHSTTFTYTLQAKKGGEINIPRLTIKTGNNSYKSQALQIQVTGGEKEQHAKPTNTSVPTPMPTAEDLFIQIEPVLQSVHVNEALSVTIKLYTQRNITGFGKMTFPSFDGFVAEAIELPTQNMTQEQYKGKKYYTVALAQYSLSPKEAGTLEITSGSYEIAVLKKQKGKKSDDFFGREKQTSDTLRVGNLPVFITVFPNAENSADNPSPIEDKVETPVLATPNSETIEETEQANPHKYLSESNRKIFFYTALVALILLIVVYSIKASSQNRNRHTTHREQGYEKETKPSLDWHLPYIIGILLLVCCLVVLWE